MSDTPRKILSKFYSENHLEQDGGLSSSSVKIEVTRRFHFYIPNFESRKKAIVKHDIHHLVTQYQTTIFGESEISAWEIASGCKNYWAAFYIDISGVMLGIPFNFMRVLKAFARGRRTKNLYHDLLTDEQALDMKVDDLKNYLGLDQHPKDAKPSFTDLVLFLGFILFGTVYSIASLALLPVVVLYTIYILLFGKNT